MTALLRMNDDYGLATASVQNSSGTCGISQTESQRLIFQPAFYDMQTSQVHISRYADGRQAPIHILDALPLDIASRADLNLVSGFLYSGKFLTRQQAADKREQLLG